MPFINIQYREINLKIAYYGPDLGGKSTSIRHIHDRVDPELRGKLLRSGAEGERTLSLDFVLPSLTIRGLKVRLHLSALAEGSSEASRKVLLRGCEGVVFVADSREERFEASIDRLDELQANLAEQGMRETPLVFQYNKRDLSPIVSRGEMEGVLNPRGLPGFDAVATEGKGVIEALKACTKGALARRTAG